MSNKEHWIILWLGIDEFTIIDGTLEDAIREARQDRNYCNYGRTGAKISKLNIVYEIDKDGGASFFGRKGKVGI